MLKPSKQDDLTIQHEDVIRIQGEAKEAKGKFDFVFAGGNPTINFSGDFRVLGCSLILASMAILAILCPALAVIIRYILMIG